ncbi:LysR family transcriptional regulator (chromosome initiation inhibitor) [Pseudoduganella flava]|uniref:ArgP/LysG family DNA-binding transcriptional regulator n=1 Tax=Pseudoduganella flava TaxID=871742 RepID=A0A562PK36_9BURK|nr:LysR family transcriptional regulator ArgP [Pseudoduganella flava]QGZ42278.1 ArgP/LysG family DNA-binding transcriptional regulator [Pseudoduganella flava]TWI44821.1 LysR family transcriptional regulator (chromosome initiation inhibitor) [Pseudoduganella flava]
MTLDTRQCDAFLAALESGSFDGAAAQLRVTPSAVSQRIAALETALGSPLLIRSRPCRATAAGQRLLVYLRRNRLLEEEFLSGLQADDNTPLRIPIAVNNDSLATWLLPGIADFLLAQRLTLDIVLDEQNYTYALLEKGEAVAGISSEGEGMRGCIVEPLGAMRYRMLASPQFAARHFPDGWNRASATTAPVIVFSRKDRLQSDFIERELGLMPGHYPLHYVPASDPFLQAIRLGLGYGMVPPQQYGDLLDKGELVDLAPGRHTDVPLYWHAWRVQSPALERLGREVVRAARAALDQP